MYSQRQLKFYKKIEDWLHQNLLNSALRRPLYLGISSPNGAGKSTLTQYLVKKLNEKKIKCVGLSIDDFYLDHATQQTLAQGNPHISFWQQRGYPGTHDILLGTNTLEKLKHLKSAESLLLPRYNKSAFNGEGDRLPQESWDSVDGPIDLVILEGWMLGFMQQKISRDHPLFLADQKLIDYQAWHQYLDAFIYLKAKDSDYVIDWRIEAEDKRRQQGLDAMSEETAKNYAESFVKVIDFYQSTPENQKTSFFLQYLIEKDRLPKVI